MDKQELGLRIKSIRLRQDIKQEELAEQLCVSQPCVARWENGSTLPDPLTLKRIADICEASLDEYLSPDLEDSTTLIRVNNTELKILNALRAFSKDRQSALLKFLYLK